MKLFGFHISAHDWRHKYEVANARANRNAHNATQYEQACREARKELTKTNEQMEAARLTHERQLKELRIERAETMKKLKEAKKAVEFEKDVNAVTNSNREVERQEYEERIKAFKEKLNAHDEKVGALNDYIAELEKQIEGLKHELTATTGKIPNRDQVLLELQKRVAELETACDKLIDENTEYSTKNENLRLQISTQKELLVELQMELDTYKERHEHKKELKMARQQRYRENKRNKAEIKQESKK